MIEIIASRGILHPVGTHFGKTSELPLHLHLLWRTSRTYFFHLTNILPRFSIPIVPTDLVDASKACLATLTNSLISVMQRVNTLTTAIDDQIIIEEETGNIVISIPKGTDLTE